MFEDHALLDILASIDPGSEQTAAKVHLPVR